MWENAEKYWKKTVLINIVLSHLGSHVTPRFVTWRDTVTCHNVNIMGRVCGHLRFQGPYKDSRDFETGTGSGYWEYPWHQPRENRILWFVYFQSTFKLHIGNSQCKGSMNENRRYTQLSIDSFAFVIPKTFWHYLLFLILFIGCYFNKAWILLIQNIPHNYAVIRCNVNIKCRCLNNDAITGYLVR